VPVEKLQLSDPPTLLTHDEVVYSYPHVFFVFIVLTCNFAICYVVFYCYCQ